MWKERNQSAYRFSLTLCNLSEESVSLVFEKYQFAVCLCMYFVDHLSRPRKKSRADRHRLNRKCAFRALWYSKRSEEYPNQLRQYRWILRILLRYQRHLIDCHIDVPRDTLRPLPLHHNLLQYSSSEESCIWISLSFCMLGDWLCQTRSFHHSDWGRKIHNQQALGQLDGTR